MNNDRLKFRTPYYLPNPDGINEFVGFAHWDAISGRPNMMVVWDNDEQCTGLRDINGKLIYAGDRGTLTVFGGIGPNGGYVDSDKQVNAQVEWVDECAGFYFVDDNGIYYDMTNSIETFEIVGNIHEQKDVE